VPFSRDQPGDSLRTFQARFRTESPQNAAKTGLCPGSSRNRDRINFGMLARIISESWPPCPGIRRCCGTSLKSVEGVIWSHGCTLANSGVVC
jgi:hypothetical protein